MDFRYYLKMIWNLDVSRSARAVRSTEDRRPCVASNDIETVPEGKERVYLVGVQQTRNPKSATVTYSVEESLQELAKLADTAGLQVQKHRILQHAITAAKMQLHS